MDFLARKALGMLQDVGNIGYVKLKSNVADIDVAVVRFAWWVVLKIDGETEEGIVEYQLKMPGLCQKSAHHSHSSSTSTSTGGGSLCNARNGIWSRSRDDITFAQLHRFWSELPSSTRQELLRIDKQSLFEQVRKNLYCSRCNGLLLEVFSQIVHYGKSIQQQAAYANIGGGPGQYRNHNENGSKLMVATSQDDTSDPSVHPSGGLTTTRDGVLTLLDYFLVGTSLEALQKKIDSAREREREHELLYPDACGGRGRGWISQGTSTSGRGHGMKETCASHTARLFCEVLVDFWSALGEEIRSSFLCRKEEDFIERLMFRFDSKIFCRDCRRNVLREFKEFKELKRTRREPRCTIWFCVTDTAFQYEVSDSTVQADWHECFAEAGGMYQCFEWAVGTGEGKSDILGFEDVGLCGSVQAYGLALDNIDACYITLRAWKHDRRCTKISVKAHSLEDRLCVHRSLIVGDGYVTITKGESIRRFFEHAEETEEEDSNDKEGNDLDTKGSRPQKHAKSLELARDFLLDAASNSNSYGDMMGDVLKALSSNAPSLALQQACAKAVSAMARYTIDPSSFQAQREGVIRDLVNPLLDVFLGTVQSLAEGEAQCLQDLVETEVWKCAPDDIVDEICLRVMALEEKGTQTSSHMKLVCSLAKLNSPIPEAYGRSLLKATANILETGVVTGNIGNFWHTYLTFILIYN